MCRSLLSASTGRSRGAVDDSPPAVRSIAAHRAQVPSPGLCCKMAIRQAAGRAFHGSSHWARPDSYSRLSAIVVGCWSTPFGEGVMYPAMSSGSWSSLGWFGQGDMRWLTRPRSNHSASSFPRCPVMIVPTADIAVAWPTGPHRQRWHLVRPDIPVHSRRAAILSAFCWAIGRRRS